MNTALTTLLVLGGNASARRATDALTARLEAENLQVRIVYSLAGVTRSPRLPSAKVEVRSGGFGGVEGLQSWLQDNKVEVIVDATHPFAEQISANARDAARALNLPLFRLLQPLFPRVHTKKRFTLSSNKNLLCKTLPRQNMIRLFASLPSSYRRSVLCALGAERIVLLAKHLPVRRLLLRSFASSSKIRRLRLQNLRLRRARCLHFCTMPPASAQSVRQEMRAMKRQGVSMLLCRDSGAREAFAKILAAQKLSLPVVLLARPPSLQNSFFVPTLTCRDLSPVVRLLQQQSHSSSSR